MTRIQLIESIKPLAEVFVKVPSSEVEKIFSKFLGGQTKEAKPEGGEEKYASNSKEKADKAGARSIDESFGELLDSK